MKKGQLQLQPEATGATTLFVVLLAVAGATSSNAQAQPIGRSQGPGWAVDHVKPLCAGGEDKPANMQWIDRPRPPLQNAGGRAGMSETAPVGQYAGPRRLSSRQALTD